MDIDFIKWMCEKADGFIHHVEFSNLCIDAPDGFRYTVPEINRSTILYPLLLQRAIEGWNRLNRSSGKFITIEGDCVSVSLDWVDETIDYFYDAYGDNEDQAKESALKYIYEQEKA